MESIELKGHDLKYDFLCGDNFGDLVTLFRNVNDSDVSISALKRKYDRSSLGLGYFGCFMYDEKNHPIGFQGAIPYIFEYKNELIICAQSGDSMTNSAFRGIGVFRFLSTKVDELLTAKGVKLIYGFPNQNSKHIFFDKLDWKHTGSFYYYAFSVSSIPVKRIFSKITFLRHYFEKHAMKQLAKSGEQLESMSNSERAKRVLSVVHDDTFFEFKSSDRHIVLRFNTAFAWLKLGTDLLVGDFCLNSGATVSDFIKELRAAAKKARVSKLIFQCQEGSKCYEVLNDEMEGKASWDVGYKIFDPNFSPDDFVLTYGDIDTF